MIDPNLALAKAKIDELKKEKEIIENKYFLLLILIMISFFIYVTFT